MKLNYDCVRDILLVIEKSTTYNQDFTLSSHKEELSKYTLEELQYHLRQCELAGFLHEYTPFMNGDISITDLSFQGHEFLNTVRPEKVWTKTTNISKDIGVKTLKGLVQISTQVVTQIIANHLQIK